MVVSQSGICPVIMNMSEMNASGMTMPLLTATVSSIDGSAIASASPSALKQADASTQGDHDGEDRPAGHLQVVERQRRHRARARSRPARAAGRRPPGRRCSSQRGTGDARLALDDPGRARLRQADGEEREGRHDHAERGHAGREVLHDPHAAALVDDLVADQRREQHEEEQRQADAEDERDGGAAQRRRARATSGATAWAGPSATARRPDAGCPRPRSSHARLVSARCRVRSVSARACSPTRSR